ncbi:hypothetical protein B1H18_15475 [Streptomyces tsukubensis]|uniref:Integral membrane protein n=2 Tax=Streptomyces tsukubensis TaxID=83656 RepID=A0A1V4A816_9ACTN|nr:hypothetical protein B1H18_15475 [Streptomyces tsukubensis]
MRLARRARALPLWLLALAAFAFPLVHAVDSTLTYVDGYASRLVTDAKDDALATAGYYWHDPRGRAVHGRIADVPFEWSEEYVDGTGTHVWVSREGVAYIDSPAVPGMAIGYTGAGLVAVCVALVLWSRHRSRVDEDNGEVPYTAPEDALRTALIRHGR